VSQLLQANCCVIAATIFAIPVYVEPWLFGDVVVYNAFCTTQRTSGQCNGTLQWSGATTYKASFEGQFVIFKTENSEVGKYQPCAVKDYRNWSCILTRDQYGEEENSISMSDGNLSGNLFKFDQIFSVSALEWYWLKIKNTFTGGQR